MTDIRGLQVTEVGTYVLMADVVQAIREYAQSLDDANSGALIHDLATWLDGGLPSEDAGQLAGQSRVTQVAPEALSSAGKADTPAEIFGAESDDVTLDVARVEIFPDNPDDPRPRWHARSVDTGGYVLKTTNGSFDQEWVIQNAQERWPGIDIIVVRHAGEDSKWKEDSTRGVFPSLGPPTRRLWAGVSTYERAEQGGVHRMNA